MYTSIFTNTPPHWHTQSNSYHTQTHLLMQICIFTLSGHSYTVLILFSHPVTLGWRHILKRNHLQIHSCVNTHICTKIHPKLFPTYIHMCTQPYSNTHIQMHWTQIHPHLHAIGAPQQILLIPQIHMQTFAIIPSNSHSTTRIDTSSLAPAQTLSISLT